MSFCIYELVPTHEKDGTRISGENTWISWGKTVAFISTCILVRQFKKDPRLHNLVIFLDTDKFQAQIHDKDGEFFIVPRKYLPLNILCRTTGYFKNMDAPVPEPTKSVGN